MNIAILHYHLNRGGVTRVIANQLLALESALGDRESCRVAIFFGGDAHGWPDDLADRLRSIDLIFYPVANLGYDTQSSADPDRLAGELEHALERLDFSPPQTLLHAHNHSLGKNASLPGALGRLARDGFALLLQIHDFAEDFRPDNYRHLEESLGRESLVQYLYPQATNIHYATLNRRDHDVLRAAGVAESRLHFLPNPVPTLHRLPDRSAARAKLRDCFGIDGDQTYLLYPVRGIRRKNLGETLLCSLLFPEGTQVGITLEPLNPVEQSRYNRWKQLAADFELPCHFETGGAGALTFEENLSAADAIFTTSVAEGFGMAFLESWLAERPLIGRNLPEVTADFVQAGVSFDSLYDRLDVPIDWIGRERFAAEFQAGCTRSFQAYGLTPVTVEVCQNAIVEKLHNDCLDFADLNEPLQEQIIRLVHCDEAKREELRRLNPGIASCLASGPELIRRNRELIERTYALEPSGIRLHDLYRTLLEGDLGDSDTAEVDGKVVFNRFLDIGRYRLIRS